MAEQNTGKITQIIGAVTGHQVLPGQDPGASTRQSKFRWKPAVSLVVEVAQDLGDDTVRCIAMGTTDGLRRGMDAIATGAPITVPVGEEYAGAYFQRAGRAH